jgi:hypothetical protein
MTNYIGLDAHSTTSTLVTINEAGKIINRCKVDTTERNLLNYIRSQKGKTKLVVEESGISQWVYVLLNREVDEFVVCHPGYIGKRQGPKNDIQDATHLANELRCGHITPIFHEQTSSKVIVFGGLGVGGAINTGGIYTPTIGDTAAPLITSISPRYLNPAGSETVTINGENFVNGATVDIGGSACTSVTYVSSAQLTCTSPVHAAGTVELKITNPDAQIASNGGGLHYTTTWTATTTTAEPGIRYLHTAVWSGSRMLIFGGYDSNSVNTGGSYDPIGDSWSELSTTDAPSIRHNHTAVWSGTRMLIFGGNGGSNLNTGGSYDPAGDSWTAISTTDAPSTRS